MSHWSTHASIRPTSIVVYSRWDGERRNRSQFKLPLNTVPVHLSRKSGKRLKNAIELLIYTSKLKKVYVKATNSVFWYRNNFITLTLPSSCKHDDNYIVNKMLSPFLEAWAKRKPGLLYIWKAEVTDNNTLHFHITSNTFIYYLDLRKRWNKMLEKHGIIEKGSNPNSTDVHAVDSAKNLAAYLVAYMNKKDLYSKTLKRYFKIYGNQHRITTNNYTTLPRNYFSHIKRKVNCRIWGASKALLGCKYSADYSDTDCRLEWAKLEALKRRGEGIATDYCHAFYLDNSKLLDKYFPNFAKGLKSALSGLIEIQKSVQDDTIEQL